MSVRNIFFFSLCAAIASCTSAKNVVSESTRELEGFEGCGYQRGQQLDDVRERRYQAVSWIELRDVIKDSDTLDIHELMCVDSVKFTQAFAQLEVNQLCIEMGVQGTTYFRAKTNKYGGFEEVKVVRSIEPCTRHLEEKIKQKVLSLRIIPEDAGTYEIVFCHIIRLY